VSSEATLPSTRRNSLLALLGLALIAVVAAMAWALVKNGTLLVRVGTVELPSPSAARYAMTNFDGAQHLVVAGHDPGSSSWRGLARVAQHRGECHVEVDRVAFNPSQISGDYIYIFPTTEPCIRVTLGKHRVAVVPMEPRARPRS
jgi:hypothetical protein